MNPSKRDPEVICIASGATVAEALGAARIIERRPEARRIRVGVWNAHCLKPFDEETLAEILGGVKLLVTVEDHSVIGGLGSCVAEALSGLGQHPPLIRLGIQDLFGESGDPAELYDLHGISAKEIAKTVLSKMKEYD